MTTDASHKNAIEAVEEMQQLIEAPDPIEWGRVKALAGRVASIAHSEIPVVTLSRDQADALSAWLWDEIEQSNRESDSLLRLTRLSARIFDAVEWQEDERRRSTYAVSLDPEIAWLASEILPAALSEAEQHAAIARMAPEPGQGLDLDDNVRTWAREQAAAAIARLELFITAASALIDTATGNYAAQAVA